jgi:hypothetical protein
MGSSWIDTLNARRDAAAQPQDTARPLPGTIAAARPVAAAPPVDTASLRAELSQMVRDEVATAMTDVSDMLRNVVSSALGQPAPQTAVQAAPVAPPAPEVAAAGSDATTGAPAAPWTPPTASGQAG